MTHDDIFTVKLSARDIFEHATVAAFSNPEADDFHEKQIRRGFERLATALGYSVSVKTSEAA